MGALQGRQGAPRECAVEAVQREALEHCSSTRRPDAGRNAALPRLPAGRWHGSRPSRPRARRRPLTGFRGRHNAGRGGPVLGADRGAALDLCRIGGQLGIKPVDVAPWHAQDNLQAEQGAVDIQGLSGAPGMPPQQGGAAPERLDNRASASSDLTGKSLVAVVSLRTTSWAQSAGSCSIHQTAGPPLVESCPRRPLTAQRHIPSCIHLHSPKGREASSALPPPSNVALQSQKGDNMQNQAYGDKRSLGSPGAGCGTRRICGGPIGTHSVPITSNRAHRGANTPGKLSRDMAPLAAERVLKRWPASYNLRRVVYSVR